jgi:hypothetical protein
VLDGLQDKRALTKVRYVSGLQRRLESRSWQKAGGLCASARRRGISRQREMLQRVAVSPYTHMPI